MTPNKKFIWAIVYFVVIPNFLAWLPAFVPLGFYPGDVKNLFLGLVLLSNVAPLYILYSNYSWQVHSVLWYVLGVILLAVTVAYSWLMYVLTHIQFY